MTVVIPTYNRAGVLNRCLAAVLDQTLAPIDFEVVVSDDGSEDDTRSLVRYWMEQSAHSGGVRVSYLHQANAGANVARNRAIRASAGPIILLINDDTIASRDMLAEHLATHALHPDDRVAVQGRVTVSPELPRCRLAALHLDRAFDAIGNRRELDLRGFFTCNVSVKRSLLDRGGIFEERLHYHEDLELSERLSHHGLHVIYNPNALGYHYHFLTEEEFLGVARREARALVQWFRKSPQLAPVLAEFGFEPALSPGARRRSALRAAVFDQRANAFWRWAARQCPRFFEGLALKIYLQIYQTEKRACLLTELGKPAPAIGVAHRCGDM
jgi:glycosyltransferase involved in cell wall biosynthesis